MLKVVVVEDEELVRKGIVLAVDWASVGCAVVGEAANGQEGLEVIARYRPDLIVTDIKMPRLDGLEMVRQLRAQGNRAYVILLTAYSDFSYAQASRTAKRIKRQKTVMPGFTRNSPHFSPASMPAEPGASPSSRSRSR